MTYPKYFLVTMVTAFMATHGAAASTAAAMPTSFKEDTSAASRAVAVIGDFAEADIRTRFSRRPADPVVVKGWITSGPVEEEPNKALAELLTKDPLGLLNPKAFVADNLRGIFAQVNALIPYVDALTSEYVQVVEKLRVKSGGIVKPVLPAGAALTDKDKALLSRDSAEAARREVAVAMGIVEKERDEAKTALQAANRKALEEKAAAAKAMAAMKAELEGQIAALQSKIQESIALEKTLKDDNDTLTKGIMDHKGALASKEAQITALQHEVAERDAALEKAAKGSGGSAVPLLPEGDVYRKKLHDQLGLLVASNTEAIAYIHDVEVLLSAAGLERPGTRPHAILDKKA